MISVKAYAKINIGLRILNKREDGYHNIETIFHRVNPFDEIIFEPSNKLTLSCTDPGLPTDENNLCIKAAKLLLTRTKNNYGARISLYKKIPIGGGLGGGSSDAASTLIVLNKLWNLNIDKRTLTSLALQLGSDVPYFLNEGTAYAAGRGEILEYFQLPLPYWIVVIYPDILISTGEAYKLFENTPKHKEDNQNKKILPLKEIVLKHLKNPEELTKKIHNDFEPIILHNNEIIRFCKISLYAAGAKFAQMSGSGSSLYGFFTDQVKAFNAVELFSRQFKVFITPPGKPDR